MSSQKGNTSRSRPQKHQNTFAFKNNKYGATVQVKKANSKVHEGLCQRCKEVLEWKVKYSKYKSLTQARKCVKCSQKTVKDAYHVMCKPCALQLEICAKCGNKEDIVIPIHSQHDGEEEVQDTQQNTKAGCKTKQVDDSDSDNDFGDMGSDDDNYEDDSDMETKKIQKKINLFVTIKPDPPNTKSCILKLLARARRMSLETVYHVRLAFLELDVTIHVKDKG